MLLWYSSSFFFNAKIPHPPTNWTFWSWNITFSACGMPISRKEEQTNFIYYTRIAYKAIYLMDESH